MDRSTGMSTSKKILVTLAGAAVLATVLAMNAPTPAASRPLARGSGPVTGPGTADGGNGALLTLTGNPDTGATATETQATTTGAPGGGSSSASSSSGSRRDPVTTHVPGLDTTQPSGRRTIAFTGGRAVAFLSALGTLAVASGLLVLVAARRREPA